MCLTFIKMFMQFNKIFRVDVKMPILTSTAFHAFASTKSIVIRVNNHSMSRLIFRNFDNAIVRKL